MLAAATTDAGDTRGEAPYLGVARSARGLAWRERLTPATARIAEAIREAHDLPDILARILAARGATPATVPDLLAPTLRALMPDPSALAGMSAAAARLSAAIDGGEQVAIFGDYDVDGASSAALLARYLAAHGLAPRIYIPDRIYEGYGPNTPAIEALIAAGARLIVTVDCGSTSHAPLARAAALGVDVVVIDHHQVGEALPAAVAVVNPNRQDCLSGQGHLCAAGVTFLVVAAVARLRRLAGKPAPFDLFGNLDLVALATVCDVVPLRGFNRAAVAQGLKVMLRGDNPGIAALGVAAALRSAPSPYACGFVLGPRINAGGRIGNASLGAELLATDDAARAAEIAATLDRLNRERQAMETATLAEAHAMAERIVADVPETPVLVLAAAHWHKGLVGLVAARLTDRFRRPSFVFALDEDRGEATASARSLAGCDIGRAVRLAVDSGLALKGGGHEMAAGVTVALAGLPEFEAHLTRELCDPVGLARAGASLAVDGALIAAAATPEFIAGIERAGPFGHGNPQPRFVLPAHRLTDVKTVGAAHVRATLRASSGGALGGIAFRAVGSTLGDVLLASEGRVLHFAGRLTRDDWNGQTRCQLMIEDVADPARCG